MKKLLPSILAIVVVALIVALIVLKLKLVIFGIVLGALASIVYFSLTGSTLNWKIKKQA